MPSAGPDVKLVSCLEVLHMPGVFSFIVCATFQKETYLGAGSMWRSLSSDLLQVPSAWQRQRWAWAGSSQSSPSASALRTMCTPGRPLPQASLSPQASARTQSPVFQVVTTFDHLHLSLDMAPGLLVIQTEHVDAAVVPAMPLMREPPVSSPGQPCCPPALPAAV